eukprot:PLAT3292.10.p1 GENE.PLAT3292.10~~PLAT3292.10.p1  ORF type:complete len:117 (-),score=39.98 PLAT3292.10:59-409(-)
MDAPLSDQLQSWFMQSGTSVFVWKGTDYAAKMRHDLAPLRFAAIEDGDEGPTGRALHAAADGEGEGEEQEDGQEDGDDGDGVDVDGRAEQTARVEDDAALSLEEPGWLFRRPTPSF